jgi:SH3-like domain-containing protein
LKRHAVVGLAALASLLVPSAAAAKDAAKSDGLMSVKVDEANFRAGPSTSHEIMFTAIRFYPVKVLKHSKDWVKVADYEGDEAWIAGRLLSPEPTVIVSVDNANLREKGNTKSRVVGKVERSQVFRALERDGDWLKIAGDDNALGWIRQDLVWGEELASIPQVKQAKPSPRKRAQSPRKRPSAHKAKAEAPKKADDAKAEAPTKPDDAKADAPKDHESAAPPKADTPKADAPKADAPKADASEPPKSAQPHKPEAPKPEAEKPEAPKPDAEKPEAPKPDAGKPEAPKPDAGKPAAPAPK